MAGYEVSYIHAVFAPSIIDTYSGAPYKLMRADYTIYGVRENGVSEAKIYDDLKRKLTVLYGDAAKEETEIFNDKTNKPLYYEITKIAYNGIQVSASNSMRSPEIEGGFSYLTSTNNLYMVDISGLAAAGIQSVNDIYDVYLEVSFFKNDDYFAKATKTCKLRFVVD